MILEIAQITVSANQLQEFEAAFIEARKVITQADGCGAVSLHRCIETPGRYQLFVEWPTVKHHMDGFRKSPRFQEWRRILGPFFVAPPFMEHYQAAG